MNGAAITHAVYKARAFLESVNELRAEEQRFPECANPKQSGAVRRASMDLTRALAEMRKP